MSSNFIKLPMNGALKLLLHIVFLCAATDLLAAPRPQMVQKQFPFSISYTIGQSVETRISGITPFENTDGSLYGIKYEFFGVDAFNGVANYPETAEGAEIGRQITTATVDFTPQNGERSVRTFTSVDTCTDGVEIDGRTVCFAENYPEAYEEELFIPPFEWNPALKGKVENVGD